MHRHSFNHAKLFFALGSLVLAAFLGSAQAATADDLDSLQAQVDNYLSQGMMSEIDSLLSSYSALRLGQTYSPDSPVPPKSDNTDATWNKMTYSDASASKLIGYASDQCASHTTYDQLVAKGVKLDQAKFNNARDKFCRLVKAAAELKHRYDKYQAIKKDGVVLVKRSKSQKHDFKGLQRTFAGGMELVYKPDLANTLSSGVHPDQTFVYNSWIKWSDDSPKPLNIIKKIREMRNDQANNCEGFRFQVINGKEVDAWLYLDVVNASSTKVTIRNCIKAKFNGINKGHAFPAVTMEAPFGYLYELEQMKDSARVKMKDKIKDKVVSMVGANEQMIELLNKLK